MDLSPILNKAETVFIIKNKIELLLNDIFWCLLNLMNKFVYAASFKKLYVERKVG